MLVKSITGLYKLPINRAFLHHLIINIVTALCLNCDCNSCGLICVWQMKILTRNSSRMKNLALVTLGSSPGSGVTEKEKTQQITIQGSWHRPAHISADSIHKTEWL